MSAPTRAISNGLERSTIVMRGPERLVGVGFRCWLAGYKSGDIGNWEYAWNMYARELGACRARIAIGELGCWVRHIQGLAGREIATLPADDAGFCRDECVAISMIAASQHDACPALKACAFAMIGCSEVDRLVAATEQFAVTLKRMDQLLAADSICSAARFVTSPSATRH